MIVEFNEVREPNILDLTSHSQKGFVYSLSDEVYYFIDRVNNYCITIGLKNVVSDFVIKNKEIVKENNNRTVSEDFALKMLAIHQGRVKDIEL